VTVDGSATYARMIGVEDLSQNAVYKAFTREGIPTPGGQH
jgi:hypothetical protein